MRLHSKQDFRKLALRLLEPVRDCFSPGCARVDLGAASSLCDREGCQMEAFARVFGALVPYFAGGGEDRDFAEKLRRGLINGTDPSSAEYWGEASDGDQRLVESAGIALGVWQCRALFWDSLTENQRNDLVRWFAQVNLYQVMDNNWYFFRIIVNLVLRKLGRPEYDGELLAQALEQIESFYVGGGWYRDGRMQTRDYYIAWCFHYNALLYTELAQEEDPERCERWRQRAVEFADDFQHFFSPSGEAVAYGRSLSGRFSQVTFFSECICAGVNALPMEVMKGLITRNINSWLSKPIFDHGGVLTMGYAYPNTNVVEYYISPGSPYSGLQCLLLLALPDDHLFWSADEAPMPALDSVHSIPEANMIITRDDSHQLVTAYSCGNYPPIPTMGNVRDKYCKFAYSSKYAFSVKRGVDCLENIAPDNELVIRADGTYFLKNVPQTFSMDGKTIRTVWSPCDGITIETVLTPSENGCIRKHRIKADRECEAYDCGFALSDQKGTECHSTPDGASVFNEDGFCEITGGEGMVIHAFPNTNLNYARTAIPAVKYYISTGVTEIETIIKQQ